MPHLRRLTVALLLPVGLASGAAPPAPPVPPAPAQEGTLFVPANLDRSISPCADFYRYANGGWLARHPRPATHPEWGRFEGLEERNRQALRGLLEAAARSAGPEASPERKIGDFYQSCMDEAAVERQGLDPLRPELARIDAVTDLPALAEEVAHLHGQGVPALFVIGPSQDLKNSEEMILDVLQGGLGLPDRDYYLKDDAATQGIREAYGRHVAKLLELAGEPAPRAAQEAAQVVALETRLAAASKTRVERRDVPGNYHRTTRAEIEALTPHFAWRRYLEPLGLSAIGGRVGANVRVPAFLQALDAELAARPLPEWQAYLRWHLLDALAPNLASPFVAEDFAFKGKVLRGTAENLPRWQRCVASVDTHLGEALGRVYVETYFPPAAKRRIAELVDNLAAALDADLKTLDWMGEATRSAARQKLAAMTRKIGYPERWTDYGALPVGRGSYAGNVLAAQRFAVRRALERIGKPVDRGRWEVPPTTVDAYYQPAQNEIVFPAGILQPPYFDPAADDAWNYGAIGSFIGHEMTHGFDDQGSQFDARGNLRNWWAPADLASFKRRAACVARHYAGFSVDGVPVNGDLVVGEAIADLGGVKLAYAAYQRALAGKPRPIEAGFTPEQRFFLAFAAVWAVDASPELERLWRTTNPHPLPRFRVGGVVSDLPEFASAFSCQPADPLVRPAGERCQIW